MQGCHYGRWCDLCHDDELSTTSDSMEKCCSHLEEGDGASQQQTLGGGGNWVVGSPALSGFADLMVHTEDGSIDICCAIVKRATACKCL